MAAGAGSAASATGLPHAECEGEVRDFVGSRPGMQDGKNGYAWFNSPQGLCVDPRNEDVYIADTNNHRIRVAHIDGTVETVLGNDNSRDSGGEFNSPKSIALWIPPGHEDDSDAHTAPVLYVGEGGGSNPLLFRVTCSGTRSGRRTWSKEAVAGQGESLDESSSTKQARDTALGKMRNVGHNDDAPGNNVTFKTFRHMSVYKNLLFIADYRRVRVMNIGDWSSDSYHFVVTVVGREACNTNAIDTNGPDGSSSAFDHATLYPAVGGSGINIGEVGGVCADTKGGLIVADYNRHCLIHVDKVVDADGKLLADAGSRKARVIAGQWRSSGNKNGYGDVAHFSHPQHLTMSEDGEFLYVADSGNSLIRRVDMGGDGGRHYRCSTLSDKISSTQALTGSVNGRRLYVVDTGSNSGTTNHRIRVVVATMRPQVACVPDNYMAQMDDFEKYADIKGHESLPFRVELKFEGEHPVRAATADIMTRLPFLRDDIVAALGSTAEAEGDGVVHVKHPLSAAEFEVVKKWCRNVTDLGLTIATAPGVLAFAASNADMDHLASKCEEYISRGMSAATVLPLLVAATKSLNAKESPRVKAVHVLCQRYGVTHLKEALSLPGAADAMRELQTVDPHMVLALTMREMGLPAPPRR